MRLFVRIALSILAGIFSAVLTAGPAASQQAPLRGVVWEPPADPGAAQHDLVRMRRMGVQAVRTSAVRDRAVLAAADRLGIQVFQDLPVAFLPAGLLLESLDGARNTLETVLATAREHPSARHFGLAYLSDTSDPAACAYFEALAGTVREQFGDSASVYYTTAFVAADRCAAAVDFVLIHLRDLRSPEQLEHRWRTALDSLGARAIGVASLGTWTSGDSLRGLSIDHSLDVQARYLENGLNTLLQQPPPRAPVAVFVHRWRDGQGGDTRIDERDNPYGRHYGILGNGTSRPAFDVVEGIFTGKQTVFAFPPGAGGGGPSPWPVLLGWAVLVMLGVFYAFSPRMRQMVPRYFKAKGFYRDAIREGRDMLLGSSSVLLVALSVSVGMVVTVTVLTLREDPAFVLVFRWLPRSLADTVRMLMDQPWVLVLLTGSIYALSLVLWSSVLSIISRRRYPMSPGQVMMLVVWPRWPLLLLMLAAMVVPSLPHEQAFVAVLTLSACFVLLTMVAVTRTLYDFRSIGRVPVSLTLVTALANPVVLLVLCAATAGVLYRAEILFLWHVITRA